MNEEIKMLETIGFTNLEAKIYITLLKNQSITGYKIAKILGKNFSNIYQSLDAMLQKGMVLLEESNKNKLFIAVPIESYFEQMQKDLVRKKTVITEKLQKINTGKEKGGIYRLENINQVLIKANTLFDNAEKNILISASQIPYIIDEKLLTNLKKRNIEVVFEVLTLNKEIKDFKVINHNVNKDAFNNMAYDWLEIFIDGKEFLLSIYSKDMSILYKSLWCNEPYLSAIIYNSYLGHFESVEALTAILNEPNISPKELFSRMIGLHKKFYKGISLEMVETLF